MRRKSFSVLLTVCAVMIFLSVCSSAYASAITGDLPDGKVGQRYVYYALDYYDNLSIGGTFHVGYTNGPYLSDIYVYNGHSPYTWSYNGNLPDGLALRQDSNGSTYTLSGTSTTAGTYTFTVTVTDSNGKTASKEMTVTIEYDEGDVIISGPFPGGNVGTSYSESIYVSGGTAPYTWSYTGTLPAGLSLSSDGSIYTLRGTPTTAGTYTFRVTVTDSKGSTASPEMTVIITGGSNSNTDNNNSNSNNNSNVVYGEPGYENEGTSESHAWLINSAAVLAKVRDDINSGKINYAAYYKLTSDIDLTEYTDWEPIGGRGYESVPDVPEYRFVGHFDGNGHTVNVDIARREREYNTGLFGWVDDGGSIKNLSVSGNIEANTLGGYGYNHVGGIASWLKYGTIENCNFDGTIKASNTSSLVYAGGITGTARGGNDYDKITISGCKVGANSVTYIGATGARGYEGGIMGYLDNDENFSRVTDNYVNVTLSGNCDHSGTIYGYRSGSSGVVEDNTVINNGNNNTNNNTNNNNSNSNNSNNNSNNSNNNSNNSNSNSNNSNNNSNNSNSNSNSNNNVGNNVVYGEPGYETKGTSESSAWEINSTAVLAKVRDDINSGKVNYAAYYKLTSDIDLTEYTDWEPIGGGQTITRSDQPKNKFVGHFDGNGHTVKVNISRRGSVYNAGLFGWVDDGGSIKNLSVSGNVEANSSSLWGDNNVGGIASRLSSGTIENCNFDGTVNASHTSSINSSYAGGITGFAGGKKITVTGCKVGSKSATSIGATGRPVDFGGQGYEGGIIGDLFDNNSGNRVTDNYANVTLSGNANHSGEICGLRVGSSGTVSNNTTANNNGNTNTNNGNNTNTNGNGNNTNTNGNGNNTNTNNGNGNTNGNGGGTGGTGGGGGGGCNSGLAGLALMLTALITFRKSGR